MANAQRLIFQQAWPCTKPEIMLCNSSSSSRSLHCSSFQFQIFPKIVKSNAKKTRLFSCGVKCSSMKPRVDKSNATNLDSNPPVELKSGSDVRQLAPPNSPNQSLPSKCSKGLIFDVGCNSSWDCASVGSPVVRRFIGDDEERWYMWYHGSSSSEEENQSDSIGIAASKNGVHWGRGAGPVRSCGDAGMVMNCSKNWWAFDMQSIRPSDLVIMSSPMYSSVYWLYYSGFSTEEVELPEDIKIKMSFGRSDPDSRHQNAKVFKSLPGLACSQDGRHWARIEGDHHSGALLDVGSSEKDWDSLFIGAPKVLMHSSDDFRMYYHSFDVKNGHFAIGLARSRDGIRWVKLGKVMGAGLRGEFDELGAMNASVVKKQKEGKYLMAYEGVAANGERSIGIAESPDGLKSWKRIHQHPVLEPSGKDGWDNAGVGSPCLVQMDGKTDDWRLYYTGISRGGRAGIGMAASKGNELGSFRRWAGLV